MSLMVLSVSVSNKQLQIVDNFQFVELFDLKFRRAFFFLYTVSTKLRKNFHTKLNYNNNYCCSLDRLLD